MTRPRCQRATVQTGTITFTLYAPDGTTVVYTDHVTVNGNGVYTTTSGDNPGGYVPIVAGTYEWTASYSGDGNNNAVSGPKGDEPVIATTQITFLTTSAIPSSVTLDSTESATLKDSGTLTGGFNPTGSLTFTLYAPDGSTVVDTETVTVSGNGTYSTPTGYTLPTTGLVTGTYQWVVSYSGDPTTTPRAPPRGTSRLRSHRPARRSAQRRIRRMSRWMAAASPTLKDSATLAGAYNATGTITFSLYAPDGTTVVDTEMVTVSGNGTYTHADWLHAADQRHCDRNLPVGCQLQRRRQQQRWKQHQGRRAGHGRTGKPDDQHNAESDGCHAGWRRAADAEGLGHARPGGYNAIGSISFRLYAPDGTTVLDTETVTGTATARTARRLATRCRPAAR